MTPQPIVAIVDSGLCPRELHDATLLPGINLSAESTPDDTNDLLGHGTQAARTILTIAPNVLLLPVKVTNRHGVLTKMRLLETAFAWIAKYQRFETKNDLNDPKLHAAKPDPFGVHVVYLAIADKTHRKSDEEVRTERLCQQIAELRAKGIFTVAPAGNWHESYPAYLYPGMAWPAIAREVVSVGALESRADELWVSPGSRRLQASLENGCSTTIFALPDAPGATSGAAAVVAGHLAVMRSMFAEEPPDELLQRLVHRDVMAKDESGAKWPVLAGH